MRFVVLGPVGVTVEGRTVRIDRAQRRALLAYLLLHANETVSPTQLVDALWGGAAPATAKTQVFAAVSAIRRALRAVGHDPVFSTTGGYRLSATAEHLDLAASRELIERSKEMVQRRDLREAAITLRSALALWQGSPLSGVAAAFVEPARAHLEEQRLLVQEQLYELELDLGRHHNVIAELFELAAANPFRERLTCHLMLALYRGGRQADALAAYRRIRGTLLEELGIDPAQELEQLHNRILNNDPKLVASVVPDVAIIHRGRRFLPRDIPDFIGRAPDLERLDEFASAQSGATGAVIIIAIAGVGGVGKTALAIHWAHRAASQYPDGQLYLNLRGYDERHPMLPIEALNALLRALGVPSDHIPHDLDEASALYRATLADQKVLILLDNANSVDQVRPLLPASHGSLILITSRAALGGLIARDGARRITLGNLIPAEAISLLTHILGPDRVGTDPRAVEDLALMCGYLPLALRIAAANLAGLPNQTISAQVKELTRDGQLAALAVDGDPHSNVRIVFDQSYRWLHTAEQRFFRLLGLIPGSHFTAETTGELANLSIQDSEAMLSRLADAHLVTVDTPGRYHLHDLLRAYAARLCQAEDTMDARQMAVSGLLDWYVHATDAATRAIRRFQVAVVRSVPLPKTPIRDIADLDGAMAWLDAEYGNLIASIRAAAVGPWYAHAVQLPHLLQPYFTKRGFIADWIAMLNLAEEAACRLDDTAARAHAMTDLGFAHTSAGQTAQALIQLEGALQLHRQLGGRHGEATTLNHLGSVFRRLGRHAESADHYQAALDLFRELDDPVRQASTQSNLSVELHLMGRNTEALNHAHHALGLQQRIGGSGEAALRTNLGLMYARLDRHAEAVEQSRTALELHRRAASGPGEANALANLSFSYSRLGQHDEAERVGLQALELAQRLSYPEIEAMTLNTLGEACHFRGDCEGALKRHREALTISANIGDTDQRTRAHDGIAKASADPPHSAPNDDRQSDQ